MRNGLKPLKDAMSSMTTAVHATHADVGAFRSATKAQQEETAALTTRIGNLEYNADLYWKNPDGRVQKSNVG